MRQNNNTRRSKKQEKRRYPFSEKTKLIEFVDKRHYGSLLKLLKCLRPYLIDGEESDFKLKRLYFDKKKLLNNHQVVFDELALFLLDVKEGLRQPQSVLIRYLSTPEHCNLQIKEESLKALIIEAKRRYS